VNVTATHDWLDDELVRHPAGEVHGWLRGHNQTVCRLALSRSRLRSFADVEWADVQPASGGRADAVQVVCARCTAGIEGRTSRRRRWTRDSPRP
jgi:hypothetical protein